MSWIRLTACHHTAKERSNCTSNAHKQWVLYWSSLCTPCSHDCTRNGHLTTLILIAFIGRNSWRNLFYMLSKSYSVQTLPLVLRFFVISVSFTLFIASLTYPTVSWFKVIDFNTFIFSFYSVSTPSIKFCDNFLVTRVLNIIYWGKGDSSQRITILSIVRRSSSCILVSCKQRGVFFRILNFSNHLLKPESNSWLLPICTSALYQMSRTLT